MKGVVKVGEPDKNTQKDIKGDTLPEEGRKEKKAGKVYSIYKKESHKDNRCVIEGIDVETFLDFNLGKTINITIEQLKIIGAELDADGNKK